MNAHLAEDIARAVQVTESRYHRLLVVVAPPGAGKTTALHAVAEQMRRPLVNLNLELAKRMLELTRQKRTLQATRLVGDIMSETGEDIVFLDNIEMIFDPALGLDPLRLLEGISRNRTVVVSWNGEVVGNRLRYAAPGHPEYRDYSADNLTIIDGSQEPAV